DLLCAARSSLCASVVSTLGAYHQLTVPFGFCIYAHLAESACAFRSARLVTDGVLVADIVGDGAADRIHLIQRLGEESDAAGALAQDLEGFFGAPGMLLVSQNANGVNGWTVLLLQ